MGARRRTTYKFGDFGGSVIGTIAGWAAGAQMIPELQVLLAGLGTAVGQQMVRRIGQSPHWEKVTLSHRVNTLLKRKVFLDLANSCVGSSLDAQFAMDQSRQALASAKITSRLRVPEIISATNIDYELRNTHAHIENVARQHSTITVSCPSLFPSIILALNSLRRKLARYSVSLIIDSSQITSKLQMRQLATTPCDYAIVADPAYLLGCLQTRRSYKRLVPLFKQIDCLLGLSDSKERRSSHKVFFHEGSTGELMLSSSAFGTNRRSREALSSPLEIPPLIESLSIGEYVTSWEPLTTVLTDFFENVGVVTGTRYSSYVSLYTRRELASRATRKSTIAFTSLLVHEINIWSRASILRRQLLWWPRVFDQHAFAQLSGMPYLLHGA